ncbi:MAG: EpsG family protein [Bacteroidaceae bacterium]|nr:EpsG family protein [Bacteroidaceae bacterium]
MELFAPQLYFPLSLFLTMLFILFQSNKIYSISNRSLIVKDNNNFLFVIFAILFTIVVGLRPVSGAFGDTVNYAHYYWNQANDLLLLKETLDEEWVFTYLMHWFAARDYDIMWFFLFVEILYVVPISLACRRLSANNYTILLLFCFSAFSFFTYGVNGIRNGMACSLVIMALTFIQGNIRNKIICGVLCFLALNIHRSTALPIIAMLYTYYLSKPRHMFFFWIASIGISLVMGSAVENFFASLGFDDRMKDYIQGQDDILEMEQFSKTGFRWDFLLYSFMPIWLGWYLVFKRKIYNSTYLLLLGTYIYSNAFWVMVIRAAFSNRFAYLSWFLYPIVLAYPLIKFEIWPKQGQKTAMILLAHLGFTFVMWLFGK